MTVKVTQDEINLRSKLAELDRPVGAAGAQMMAAETHVDQFKMINAGRRNYIINGAAQIWQRGTTSTATGSGNRTYTSADRFFIYNGADTLHRYDCSSDIIEGEEGYFKFAMRVAGTQNSRILGQCVEGPLPMGDYILSAYVMFDGTIPQNLYMTHNATALNNVNDFDGFYGGSGSSVSYGRPDNWDEVRRPNVWYRIYKRFRPVDPELGIGVAFQPVWGTGNSINMHVTGVQLEHTSANTPSPFEFRSKAEELDLCMRYCISYPYMDNAEGAVAYGPLAHGHIYSSDTVYCALQFPKMMREPPSLVSSGAFRIVYDNQSDTGGSVFLLDQTQGSGLLRYVATSSTLTVGKTAWISQNNDFDARIILRAEL